MSESKIIPIIPGESVVYITPQNANIFSGEELKLYFRSDKTYAGAFAEVSFGKESMKSERMTIMANEMGVIILKPADFKNATKVTVAIKSEKQL